MTYVVLIINYSVGTDSCIQIDSDILDLERQLCEIVDSVEVCKDESINISKLKAEQIATVSKTHNLIDNVKEDLKLQKSAPNQNQLILLRSHLLNLASIENELQNQKATPKMINSDGNAETSIVESLSSLQQLFKKTINEYNKLSAYLVNTSDNSVIFKIWDDYLSHVKAFLQTQLPSDYHVLKEQSHLCKIHQNLIANQRNALMHKISVDLTIPNDFDEFRNKHVEMLNELVDRQVQIVARINAWKEYNRKQTDLLESIDDIEREKSLLQLKQIFLKSVPKTKHQISEILDRVATVEGAAADMRKNQATLINFVDEITSSAIRLNLSSTLQRLANIRASLETWDGFLIRIQQMYNNYEFHTKSVQDNYESQLNFINKIKADTSRNVNNSKQQLKVLREKQSSLVETKTDLDKLDALKDELKDYISVYDIKMIRQTIWILWQQYTDISHEYSSLINQIEERICLQTEFIIRYENIMFWLNETEGKLMETTIIKHEAYSDDDLYTQHFANNILEDFALKEYDRKWIMSVGNELLVQYSAEQNYESPEKIDIECKLANLNSKWNNIKILYDNRSRKINEVKTTYYNLEARISETRTWLFETEKELLKPFIFEQPIGQKTFENLLSDYEKTQRVVENKSATIGEMLNHCEMVLSELGSFKKEMAVKNLSQAINNIEYRWKKLCESLVNRKKTLLVLWNSLEDLTHIRSTNSQWLMDCNEMCNEIDATKGSLTRQNATKQIEQLNQALENIQHKAPAFQTLEKLYNSLLTANVDIDNIRTVTSDTKQLLIVWKTITMRISNLRIILEQYLEQWTIYQHQYENIILNLTQIDVEVTNIKHLKLYKGTAEEKDRIKSFQQNFTSATGAIELAEKTKDLLLENSTQNDRTIIENMSSEYFKLYNSIKINYDDMNVTGKKVSEERDVAIQVNMLQQQSSVSPKDAYIYEINAALNEFKTNIESLQQLVEATESSDSGTISKGTTQKINKNVAACESSLELIKYLNSLLINDYNCSATEAHTQDIEVLDDRFKLYLNLWTTKKDTKKTFAQQ